MLFTQNENLGVLWETQEVVNSTILSNGRIVTSKYPKIKNTEVYEVENRVFRIYKDTKEILDILK